MARYAIDVIRNASEIRRCCEIYFNRADKDHVPNIDLNLAVQRITKLWMDGAYMRVIRDDSDISAVIIAVDCMPIHSSGVELHQAYCVSKWEGLRSLKEMVALHEEMAMHAEKAGYSSCLTMCSPADTNMTLARMLEKKGWHRWDILQD